MCAHVLLVSSLRVETKPQSFVLSSTSSSEVGACEPRWVFLGGSGISVVVDIYSG